MTLDAFVATVVNACPTCPLTADELRDHWEAGDSVGTVVETCDQMLRDGREPGERN